MSIDAPSSSPDAVAPDAEGLTGSGSLSGTAPPARRRLGHRVRILAAAVALFAICFVALLASRPSAENTLAASPLVGERAPTITGSALVGGRFDLAQDRGRFVVVNFFASWCPACQVEEPQLVQFAAERRHGTQVAVLGVVFGDSASNAANFLRSNGAIWPAVTDPSGQIAISYGVSDPPESFLVAPDGMVLAKIVGGVTASGLDRLVAEAEADGSVR